MCEPIIARAFLRLGATALLSGVAGCADQPTRPNESRATASAHLHVVSGDSQVQIATRALAEPLEVRVTTADGKPIRGATVVFATDNGGWFGNSGPMVTDDDGRVAKVWTLGPMAGEQYASVTLTSSAGSTPAALTFRATALPDVPTLLELLVADSAEAPPAPRISFRLSARVRDAHGNGVPGVVVRWLNPTFGAVEADSTLSDREGKAVAQWILESPTGDITASWEYHALTVRIDDVRARDVVPRTIHRRVAITEAREALAGIWRAESWEFFEDSAMAHLIEDVMANGMSGTLTVAAAEGGAFSWYWRERYRWWGPDNGTDIFGEFWLDGQIIIAIATAGFSSLECDWGDCDGPLHGRYEVAFEGSRLTLTRREPVGYYAGRGPLRAWSRLTLRP